ncbi:MAG: septum formation initiator family protein [Gammaproteobacteria bacterium]|nr:septum formation initiator family protein [Gammaproteobacteria bacterium]
MPFFAGICLCLYFSYHTISGNRSYARLSDLTSVHQDKKDDLLTLEGEREIVSLQVSRMRPGSLSADMLEERARLMLGYKRADEVVVIED